VKAGDAMLARLMANAQRGDRQSYATLLAEARDWLRRYFSGRIPPHLVDDLIQETLISVHRKMASFDAERPFTPWLAAIARYRWIDQLRCIYRAEETCGVYDIAAEGGQDAISAKLSLERLFGYLPEGQASAIRLVRIEGRSVAETAKSTGQSESLVKVNIHRGLRKLAAMVEKE
jgi:RNA polymerase sigma-70 factor (ECF subfamily)